ncbi:uncharacterized protein LOC110447519 isoform X2 [Mizuhopecten yessoensis]|uniref:uncharacterized protein LOC110447519 isoform X2 n=1 Tax=Mizuhopecten yessoensis TaxID=6573 RepID=UPI000B459669|nr:uncharacterized protein LOC110447519 isoform X2 [Mizuhopecten yessoensis]
MAECAFHQEARRRQANLDRQQEARKRFIARQSQNMSGALDPNLSGGNDAIMFSGADNFDTKRNKNNWMGTERDKRQYDHSRNGPLLDSTWHNLRRQLFNIGMVTPITTTGKPTSFQDLQQVRVLSPKR